MPLWLHPTRMYLADDEIEEQRWVKTVPSSVASILTNKCLLAHAPRICSAAPLWYVEVKAPNPVAPPDRTRKI